MEVIQQVAILSLLMLIGFILFRLKILNKEGVKALSNIVIYIANPAAVFLAFQIEYKEDQLIRLGYAFILAIGAYLLMIAVSRLFIGTSNPIAHISAVLSNCGFMGIPLVRELLGNEGVFFLAAFIAINNITTWTYGVACLNNNDIVNQSKFSRTDALKNFFKTFNSPMMYSIGAGILFYALRIPIFGTAAKTLDLLGGMTTPLAMMAAGASIAQTDFKKLLKKYEIYRIGFIKLLLTPVLLYLLFLILPVDELIMRVHLIACASPTAAMCTILAIKYDKDSVYASEIFTVVTVFSMLTLPLIISLPFL